MLFQVLFYLALPLTAILAGVVLFVVTLGEIVVKLARWVGRRLARWIRQPVHNRAEQPLHNRAERGYDTRYEHRRERQH